MLIQDGIPYDRSILFRQLSAVIMRTRLLTLLAALAMLAAACGGGSDEPAASVDAADTAAQPESTATSVPEPEPTATEVPPTATPVPEPTPTPAPEPTATPEPEPEPTATEVPPTATPVPEPTATPAPESADEGATDEPATDEPAGDGTPGEGDGDVIAVVDGAAIYSTNCAGCHGANGEGARAKAITGIGAFFAADASPLVNLVTNGGTNMPSFGSKLSAEEIDAVVAHVVETFA